MTSHAHAELCRRAIAAIGRVQPATTPQRGDDAQWIDLRHRLYCQNKAWAGWWFDRMLPAVVQEAQDGWTIKDGWWCQHGVAQHVIDPRTKLPVPPPALGWPPKRVSEMAPNKAPRPYTNRPFDPEAFVQCLEARYGQGAM